MHISNTQLHSIYLKQKKESVSQLFYHILIEFFFRCIIDPQKKISKRSDESLLHWIHVYALFNEHCWYSCPMYVKSRRYSTYGNYWCRRLIICHSVAYFFSLLYIWAHKTIFWNESWELTSSKKESTQANRTRTQELKIIIFLKRMSYLSDIFSYLRGIGLF